MDSLDVVSEFLVQSHDYLDRLEHDLVALEREPTSTQLLNRVIGVVHTLGVSGGVLNLRRFTALTDGAEELLAQISRGRVAFTPDVADGLLSCADSVRAILDVLEATGGEGEADDGTVLTMLDALAVPAEPPLVAPLGEVLVQSGLVTPAAVSLARHAQEMGDPRPLGEILLTQGSLTPPQLAAGLDTQTEKRYVLDRAVRVDSDVLDTLSRLADQLGGAGEALRAALAAEPPGPGTVAAAARLAVEIDDARECIRQTRVRRLDDGWICLPRVVRDTAASAGKVVTLETEGGGLRLDRALIAALRDPLILLVRNAVGHGVESPAARQDLGKPAAGLVRVTATVWGDQLVVELSDDGVGIDPMRVRSLALNFGLSSAYELARLSDAAVLQLMLLPGLTRDFDAEEPPWAQPGTPRGFGLALATLAIKAAGGVLELCSELGVGTTVRLTLPLDVRSHAALPS
jgi:two-component system chemotaxis sensor kinase CheA